MVFSSHLFIFYFLPLSLLLYYAAPRRGQHFILTALSYIFYGWANPLFMVLMFVSTLIDYVCGLVLSGQWPGVQNDGVPLLEPGGPRSRRQKIALTASICSNLGLLGFFKYFNFGIDSYNALVQSFGLDAAQWDTFFRVTLPLGISFYTFQSMSYAIDVYRGDARAIRNFTDFACYVAMFPQLVAGPIIRFQDVADQLRTRTYSAEKFARGVAFFSFGMAKKILLANACGKVADTVFNADSVACLDSWTGVVGYAFQIYFDFAGYSDMAIGLGLMFGFVFAKNFDSPYQAESITDFWRRWHISLSTWLRDNLYLPLGGNRKGTARTYANLATVMVLGGLWHGASWNFVIWGAIHGAMLGFERAQGKDSFYSRLPGPFKTALTFVIVCFTWVFFRADTLPQAVAYCSSMLGLGAARPAAGLIAGVIYQPYYLLALGAAAIVTWGFPQTWDFTRRITVLRGAVALGLLWLSLVVLTTQSFNPFIYFIF
ncbi:MAG TPA: MBOAT family O-acyltransferase [Planctomycetaceae bacterium]|jgi:alginate O-acetyltransferase complex protein AlgI